MEEIIKITYPFGATPLDDEALQALIPNLTTQAELNEFEAKNIGDAILWASTSSKLKKDLLSATGLYLLHKKMFDQTWGWAGKMRWGILSLGVVPEKIQNELGLVLGNVNYWLENETYDFEEIAVRFHHKLVWIHPFFNGNGRWSRLCADLFLEYSGKEKLCWGPDILVDGSSSRDKYIKALQIADQSEDYGPLLDFVKN